MKTQVRDRTRLAVWLCAGMLLICLLALGHYLSPQPVEPSGAAFGMVLIDIADEKTADFYHVQDCGVYVLAVQEKSPAEQAGVSSGDLLLNVNAAPICNTGKWIALQETFVPGETVTMDFQRGADRNTYTVRLVWNEEAEE